MKRNRIKEYAYNSGLYFSGEKIFRNTMIGYAYEIYIPGKGFFQADTLEGIYKAVKQYRKAIEQYRRENK